MKKLTTIFGLFLYCFLGAFTSKTQAQGEPCAFGQAMQAALAQNPSFTGILAQSDQAYVDFLLEKSGANTQKYLIPTVFHVIHNNGPENISDAQIISALSQANAQLAGQFGGADTDIRLVLATVEHNSGDCAAAPAINRVQHAPSLITLGNEIMMKDLSRWDPSKYLNVWIFRSVEPLPGQSALGWAHLPELATPGTDGIVIRFNEVGGSTNTLVHELGHYLGLYHVWGLDSNWPDACYNCDSQGPLTSGDKVPDTNPCCAPLLDSDCEIPPDFYCSGDCACSLPATPYPVENYMAYVYSCQNSFTKGQADRMHFFLESYQSRRGLWQEDNLLCAGAQSVLLDFRNTSTVEWTTSNLPNGGEIFVAGDLVIPAGKTLIIRPGVEVQFCHGGSLIIQPNARLQLHGTLTGKGQCPGSTWQGVKVYGSAPGQPQLPVGGSWAQGRIACHPGSVIENAEVGIQLYGPDPAHAGGLASCNGATIRNCRIGVKFAPYQNFWLPSGQPRPYAASFTGVNFLTDEGYPHEGGFHSFVHMTGVNGIGLTGCSFTNTRSTTSDDIAAWGYGIFANDAGFSVRSLCTGNPVPWPEPCEGYVHSTFSGLGYGVYAARIGEGRPYTVRQANFENCFVGIRNKGVTGGTILFNNFKLGELPSTAPTGDQAGIIFESHIAGFTCEENHFAGSSGNATATIGTICINTGMANKAIRQNRFEGLSIGNLANQGNAPQSPQDGIRGLYYDCNRNLDVLRMDFSVPNGRIKPKQGLEIDDQGQISYNAAGNRFSHTAVDFSNFGNPIEYFFNPFGQNEEPLAIEGDIQLVEAVQNPCPVTYCEPPCKTKEEIALVKSDYYQHKDAYLAAKARYAANPTDESARQMAYRQRMMDEDAYMVAIHELYDTLSFNADTLRAWAANLGSLEGDLWLAGLRLGAGNAPAALSLLDAAVGKYQLRGEAQADIGNYQSMASLLAGKNAYGLDAATLHSVTGYLDAKGYAAGWAKSILTLYGGHFPAEYVKYGDLIEERSAGEEHSPPASRLPEWIRASPNPAGAHVDFSISLPENTKDIALLISDINGRQVLHQHGLAPTGTFVWHTNSLGSGLYFYHLIAEGRVLKSGKIVLSK